MMPLTFLNPGEQNIIKRVGGTPEMKKHLADLGFVVGGNVTVINSVGGNIIVNVKETRVAISKEMAQKNYGLIFLIINIHLLARRKSMNTLRQAKVGDTVKVKKLHGEGAVKRRIMDMGITKGVDVKIRKVAPLGDPVEVTVRGYELSLRKADAEMIEVE